MRELRTLLVWLAMITLSCAAMAETPPRPNIVVIMADDMGYSDLGCYGSEIATPNLDRLAANGIRYSQMYNTSKCTTTRSSLLTGRYVTRTSWAANLDAGPNFGEIAHAGGYRTLWSGKNHSDIRPPERGWDRFYGFRGGACNFRNPGPSMADGSPFPHIKAYEWMVDDQWLETYIPEDPDYYMTDVITDNALSWLDEYAGEEKPFLLYLAYNAPHWPLHARDEDIAKYRGRYDGGYQAIRQERYDRMVSMGIVDPETAPLHPQDITDWNSLPASEQRLESERMEIHAAMVDSLDQNIGRVLADLEAKDELDNTLVLFFVDNGASEERDTRYRSNYEDQPGDKMGGVFSYECIGMQWALVLNAPYARHKKTSHEGGVCSPMIAHWPAGISTTNTWNDESIHLVDIMSTVMELTGQDYPPTYGGRPSKPVEGVSIVNSFSAQPLPERETVMGFDFGMGKGVRDGKWKLVKYKNNPWELYDLEIDRTETHDLAAKHADRVVAMIAAFEQWEKDCAAGLPMANNQ